jgi:hypothetical protein
MAFGLLGGLKLSLKARNKDSHNIGFSFAVMLVENRPGHISAMRGHLPLRWSPLNATNPNKQKRCHRDGPSELEQARLCLNFRRYTSGIVSYSRCVCSHQSR